MSRERPFVARQARQAGLLNCHICGQLSRALAGSCEVPLGAYAEVQGGELWLRGFVALPDGSRIARAERRGPIDQPEALGLALAEMLRADGADEILASL